MSFTIPIREDLKKDIQSLSLREASIGHPASPTLAQNINLNFQLGKIIWVTGVSGIGKSTFLRTLTGLVTLHSGDYCINDTEIVNKMSFEEFMPYRLNIGYSFEMGGLLNNRTLWDNLMLPLQYHKAARYRACEQRVNEIMKMFAIEKYKNERPAAVPGGTRKAACVARAFMLDPQVLIFDKPTTGLNEDGIGALLELLRKKENAPLVFISSDGALAMEKMQMKN